MKNNKIQYPKRSAFSNKLVNNKEVVMVEEVPDMAKKMGYILVPVSRTPYLITIFLLAILLSVFSTTGVYAAPPFQTSNSVNGIQVEFSPFQTYTINENITVQIHAYNSSTGFPLTNSTTSCYMNTFYANDSHYQGEAKLSYDSSNNDWEHILKFSQMGDYYFQSWCNTTNQGGFATVPITINPNVPSFLKIDLSSALIIAITIGILILGVLFVLWGFEIVGAILWIIIGTVYLMNNASVIISLLVLVIGVIFGFMKGGNSR